MSEAKAFIQEQIIYEYMKNRLINNELSMYQVIKGGKELKKRKVDVKSLKINNTFFPDVDEIIIDGISREAEVKFLTSDFKYHITHEKKFEKFKNRNGCIIVIKHDELPLKLPDDYKVDVFQLDKDDFSAFVRENFERFYDRQLNSRAKNSPVKIWLTSQSINFHGKVYKKSKSANYNVQSADKTKIWCPIYKSQINELDIHDKVVFVGFKGADKQNARRNGITNPKWLLNEIYISQVIKIETRENYCRRKNININTQLWIEDKKIYNYVFEFKELHRLKLNIKIEELPDSFIEVLYDVYTQPGMREIGKGQYMTLLENCFQLYQRMTSEKLLELSMVNKSTNK